MTEAIAHYNILERLGEGSLGEVFRARDMKYGRTVILKVTPPADDVEPAIRARFLDNARAAAALSHPNIATLFDVGEHGNRYFMAYEFVSGTPLRQQMTGPMNPRHALEIAVQIAEALAEAHSRGIVHTDLRPETIYVSGKGSSKVLDFGMSGWTRGGAARRQAARAPESLDANGAAVVPYMSPEQAIGGTLDARTDLFSLGVIVYEMLTGKNPYAAATPAETLVNITRNSTPAGTQTSGGLPKEIEPVIVRALAKDIGARHQSAVAMASELRQAVAALDAKAGELPPPAVLAIDDERDGSGKAWIWLLVIAAAAIAIWFAIR